MGNGVGTNLFGVAGNGDGLENALRRYRDGVAVVAQHIAENHILERLLIILVCNVKRHIFFRAKLIGVLLVGLQLFGAETTCVGACSVNVVAVVLQFHHSVGGVETSRKCHHYFLLCHIFMIFCYKHMFADFLSFFSLNLYAVCFNNGLSTCC